MKYYSRKCINYSRDRKITCGNEILLAGIQYYSRKWIITRGKKYYSRERIITRGDLFITRGNDILLAGEKYWQYMAPEGFRIYPLHTSFSPVWKCWDANTKRLTYPKFFPCPTFQIQHSSQQMVYTLQGKFAKIQLHFWQFWLSQAMGYVEPWILVLMYHILAVSLQSHSWMTLNK